MNFIEQALPVAGRTLIRFGLTRQLLRACSSRRHKRSAEDRALFEFVNIPSFDVDRRVKLQVPVPAKLPTVAKFVRIAFVVNTFNLLAKCAGQADCAGLIVCESGVTELTSRILKEQTVFCFASSPAQDELLAVSASAF